MSSPADTAPAASDLHPGSVVARPAPGRRADGGDPRDPGGRWWLAARSAGWSGPDTTAFLTGVATLIAIALFLANRSIRRRPPPEPLITQLSRYTRGHWGDVPGGVLHAALTHAMRLGQRGVQVAEDAVRPVTIDEALDRPIDLPLDNDGLAAMFLHRFGGFLLIRGEPGMGKSVLLWRLADGLAIRHLADPSRPAPLLLEAHRWGPGQTIAEFIRDEASQPGLRIPLDRIDEWLAAGNERIALLIRWP